MLYLYFIIACFPLTLKAFRSLSRQRFQINPLISAAVDKIDISTKSSYEKIVKQIKDSVSSKSSADASSNPITSMMDSFLDEYSSSSLEANQTPEQFQKMIRVFFREVGEAIESPFQFSPHHQAIRQPFDYYQWGNDFLRPLVIAERSKLFGIENLKRMEELLKAGGNVVILSNHQTEADPQVISILLEQEGLGDLAQKIIFIAGHKVTNDPVAIPFSKGRNLLCIHSKKHIKNPPEEMPAKQAQNLRSMSALGDLFSQGGNVFWVAPSGGRDRPDETGAFVVAPFDIKALDMFKLLAMQSQKPAHFFPMAMYTHQLVPPPKTVSSGLGEVRSAKRGEVSVHCLTHTDGLGGLKDKEFASAIQQTVEEAYAGLCKWHSAK